MTITRPSPARCAAVASLAACATLVSCASDPTKGYSFSSTYDESVRTVAVPIFDNNTFYPGLEIQLTEAVTKEIQRVTPWKVAARASADTELALTITDARYRTLSTADVTGLPEEQAFVITVSFEWSDNRTREILAAHDGFSAAGTSIQSRPTSERVEVGQREALKQLAQDIVAELRSNW